VAATREAVEAGCSTVVAAGGDGTIGLVARQLLHTPTALGILPLGSIMNIPRMMGIPRDLEAAARILRDGAVRRIDVGQVEGGDVFLEGASVGLPAAVFREAAQADTGDRLAIWRSIVTAFRYRPSRLVIELDAQPGVPPDPEQVRRTRALLVAVANGPFMGAGFTVAPDARLDDGLLDVRIFRHWSKQELIRHFVAIAFGRRAYAPHVETARTARVTLHGARPLPARADGTDLGVTPITFTVRPGSLLVVAPTP
jgi:diacylglycerol kinase (ATP)